MNPVTVKKSWYTYVLQSLADGNFYTGSTGDLRKRMSEHRSGKTTSTRHRQPLELIYYEMCLSETDARAREIYLKSGMGKRYLRNRLTSFLTVTG